MEPTTGLRDPTFRNYDTEQAVSFAKQRVGYSSVFYQVIIDHHVANGGELQTLIDVGCGSGAGTRGLATYFNHGIGIDPGKELILQARSIGGQTKMGKSIQYEVCSAEDMALSGVVEDDSVDLLSVGMAAHWFDLRKFWPNAARLIKVGGTIAMWTRSSLYCHPATVSATEVQDLLSELEDDILGPYETPSNRLSRDMYDNLIMPWDAGITAFPSQNFKRYEWNRNGKMEAGEEDFFGGGTEMTLKTLGDNLGTASMVTRWRETNADLVGTDKDCVSLIMQKVATAMGADGSDLGDIKIRTGSSTTLLIFTRVAE